MPTAAIIGARGYLGRETLRILLQHPAIENILPATSSDAGTPYGRSVPAYAHRTDLVLIDQDDPRLEEADVVFLATAGGQAKAWLAAHQPKGVVIDLSRDHRTQALEHARTLVHVAHGGAGTATTHTGSTPHDQWHFGLADTPLAVPAGTTRIANPGCYPTSALLGMMPALTAGLVGSGPLIVDGKSGMSGAGATPRPDLHYPEAHDAVRAYKVLGHDHGDEMRLAAAALGGTAPRPVRFTPHLVPMSRGLLTTTYLPAADGVTADDVQDAYANAYRDAKTVRLVDEPDTTHVRHTVLADVAVSLDEEARIIVARSAIDNLVKGGAGQAVHNMNRALGLEETLGLPMIGGGP